MPSRTIYYEAMWTSQKLESCSIWARREYPWLYGLADVNGSFETTNPRSLWMQVAPIRPDLTYELLCKVLREYHAHGLLFTWDVRGKAFAHWTGSDKPGRLPRLSQRKRFRWLAPAVPKKALQLYINRFANKRIQGDVDTRSKRVPNHAPDRGSNSKGNSNSNSKGNSNSKRSARRKKRRASSTPATQAADGTVVPMPQAFKGKRLLVSKLNDQLLNETFGHALTMQQIYKQADLWLVHTKKRRPNVLKFLSNWCKKELGGNVMATKEASVGRYAGTVEPRQPAQSEILKPTAAPAVLNQGRLLWEDIQKLLLAKINRHTYDTWFAPTRVWDWDEEEKILVVQAPNKMILHWLVGEGREKLRGFLRGMLVVFVGPDGKTQETK
ncbi:hypothetical protein LCGC14_1898070 [marine sediment metagenome]|uniref:DnaA N-terminal domain-containing protein n=1 Tax=marine sediment metagenome TaxID=412755 RepID=A0A0F9IB98_9ZZZZ